MPHNIDEFRVPHNGDKNPPREAKKKEEADIDISIFPSKLPQVPNRISIKNVSWVIYRVTLAGITMCQKKWRHAASWCHVQSKTWKQAAGCDIRKKVWCTRWMSTMHNVTSFTQSNGDITERSSFTDFFFRSKVHVHKVFQRSSLFAVWSNEWVSLVCPRQMQIGRPLCRILWRSQSFWGNAEW